MRSPGYVRARLQVASLIPQTGVPSISPSDERNKIRRRNQRNIRPSATGAGPGADGEIMLMQIMVRCVTVGRKQKNPASNSTRSSNDLAYLTSMGTKAPGAIPPTPAGDSTNTGGRGSDLRPLGNVLAPDAVSLSHGLQNRCNDDAWIAVQLVDLVVR